MSNDLVLMILTPFDYSHYTLALVAMI